MVKRSREESSDIEKEDENPKELTFKEFQAAIQSQKLICKNCKKEINCKCEEDLSDEEIVILKVISKSKESTKAEKAEGLKGKAPLKKAERGFGRIVSISMQSIHDHLNSPFAWAGKVEMTSIRLLKELLSPPTTTTKLSEALLSSFALDPQWMGKLLPAGTPLTFATRKPEELSRDTTMIQVNPFVKIIFPPMPSQFGCMHIKLIILFYPEHVRVIIPSANLIDFDWTDIENIVYYQDFPLIGSGYIHRNDVFKSDMVNLLRQMKFQDSSVEALMNYDFTNALGSLVVSKPGQSRPNDTHLYGKLALLHKAKSLGLPKLKTGQEPFIYCQSSSLGDLSGKWANEFASSIAGKERQKATAGQNFHICFPSLSTVQSSTHGINGGGTIFAQRKHWIKPSFPRHLIYDCQSTSSSTLMHSKLILYSLTRPPPSPTLSFIHPSSSLEKEGYLYLGSHNHTRAAWGGFQVKQDVLSISNWELGVIIPYWYSQDSFPVPFKIPPRAYGEDVPWIMTEHLRMPPM